MSSMFEEAASFSQDLSGWCVENIDNAPVGFNINGNVNWVADNTKQPNWGEACD